MLHRLFYKGRFYALERKDELAFSYIDKGYKQAEKEKYKYMMPFYEAFGDYYLNKKEYQKAVDYYLIAVENRKYFL